MLFVVGIATRSRVGGGGNYVMLTSGDAVVLFGAGSAGSDVWARSVTFGVLPEAMRASPVASDGATLIDACFMIALHVCCYCCLLRRKIMHRCVDGGDLFMNKLFCFVCF